MRMFRLSRNEESSVMKPPRINIHAIAPTAHTKMFFVLFVSIVLASVLIMELTGRISAKAFLSGRISEIHAQISSASASNQTEKGGAAIDALRDRLAAFEYMLDEIRQLDFSGAMDPSKTI